MPEEFFNVLSSLIDYEKVARLEFKDYSTAEKKCTERITYLTVKVPKLYFWRKEPAAFTTLHETWQNCRAYLVNKGVQ